MVNIEACSIARKNKDKNFDGKFFFAVSTTGIVCRPSCPSPVAKEENVTYFSTIYDALSNGYRPCLRCRPDIYTEFYTSNLDGQKIVSDAMKLISEGYLNSNSVGDLADHLHLSERHLRKLFVKEIGCPPIQMAKYSRAIFAKRMLINSNLPITKIAFASGFGSIRQFNNVFTKLFKMTPSELRKNNRNVIGSGTTMLLPYGKPFDFKEMLCFMRLRMIKGIETVGDDSYSRTFNIRGIKGYFVVENNDEKSALELNVYCDDMNIYREIYYKVRKMFDLDTDFEKVKAVLNKDEFIKKLLKNGKVPRLPAAFDSYEFLIRAILGQQITIKAATTLATRIVERANITFDSQIEGLDYIFPNIDEIKSMSLEEMGITKTRIETIKSVNEALGNGAFSLSTNQSFSRFYDDFTSIKGIGDWTANYIAMRGLGMVDAFPAGDMGVIKAIQKEYGEIKIKDIQKLAEKWRPYRANAAMCLWQSGEDE
jgi:AraC family transcriptional regulator of adaptative response / DNA-3-methyladenine glycosylase II